MTIKTATVELTSDCTCEYYDDEDNLVPSLNDCFGCWTDSVDYFTEFVLWKYLAAHNLHNDATLRVDVANLGWDRRTGYTYTLASSLISKLTLNGDFTLRVYLSEDCKTLEIDRSSHDEMGARFVVTPASEDEEEN
jgi:hypothetical protein